MKKRSIHFFGPEFPFVTSLTFFKSDDFSLNGEPACVFRKSFFKGILGQEIENLSFGTYRAGRADDPIFFLDSVLFFFTPRRPFEKMSLFEGFSGVPFRVANQRNR